MIRTQIQLTEHQARLLRAMAQDEGVSLAEVIRRCIDSVLAAQPTRRAARYDRARRLVGRFNDAQGATDLAADHDRYLEESYE